MSSSPDNNNMTGKEEDEPSSNDSSSSNSGIMSRINNFMDEQRLERLKQCQEIDAILKRCLERRSQLLNNEKDVAEELDINQTVPGTRMMRYFGWHQETPVDSTASFSSILTASSNDESSSAATNASTRQATSATESSSSPHTNSAAIPSCAKETHALWACRSVCLGCSPHLRNLKDCLQLVPDEVLNTPHSAYEPTSYTGMIPCRESQQELGKCVVKQAKELQQRLNQPNEKSES